MSEDIYRLWFGNNLKKYRLMSEMTQEVLSEKLGVTAQHLSYLETGSRAPSFEIISRASEILGITPADLLLEKNKISDLGKNKDFLQKISILTKAMSKEDQERIIKIVSHCSKLNRK